MAPRDKRAAKWLDDALEAVVALTGDDTEAASLSLLDPDAPASSRARLRDDLGAAWSAVHDLRALWRTLG